MSDKPFDVFLAHNSQDKPQVRAIANQLKQRGLKPWLDEEQIPPGRPFQDEIQQAIPNVKSAAIFIGSGGLGQWQVMELRSLTSRCVTDGIPVIPILLPGVGKIPDDLLFLQEFNWVSFASGIDDIEALDKLEWGITGRKSQGGRKPQGEQEQPSTYTPPIELKQPIYLPSEKGVDYSKLEKLLADGKWKEADRETLAVMLKAAGREKEGWLNTESIKNFPCTDLRTIDQLWIQYSKGLFGFSVQQGIWDSVGHDYYKFGDRLGWRKGMFFNKQWIYYSEFTFSLNAPQGHLPSALHGGVWTWVYEGWSLCFFSRCWTCEV